MAIKKFKLTEIVKYYDKVENRLGEMAKEIRNDSFNFVSIFVPGRPISPPPIATIFIFS